MINSPAWEAGGVIDSIRGLIIRVQRYFQDLHLVLKALHIAGDKSV